jgi:hypothetical protein
MYGNVPVYTPPDFIRPHMRDRKSIQKLADDLSAGRWYIDAVMEFEGGY